MRTQQFDPTVPLETRIRETVLNALPGNSLVATLRSVTEGVLEAVDLWLMQHEDETPTVANSQAIAMVTRLRTVSLRDQVRTVVVPPPLQPEPPDAPQQ